MFALDNPEKLLQNARRAKESKNYEQAEKFYIEVLSKVPENWEAIFYSTYCKAMYGKIKDMYSDAILVKNCICNSLKALIQTKDISHIEGLRQMETELIEFVEILVSNVIDKNDLFNISTRREIVIAAVSILFKFGQEIESVFGKDEYTLSIMINSYEKAMVAAKDANDKFCLLYSDIIDFSRIVQSVKPDYQTPPDRIKKKGCYIATAVYGSYDCPEVWVLRRYRDNVLSKTAFGRLFIKLYYATSPKIIKLVGKTTIFNRFWQKRLDKKVTKLRKQGFMDTPYND